MSPDNMKITAQRDEPAPTRPGKPGGTGRSSKYVLWLVVALLVGAIGVALYQNTQLSGALKQQQASLEQATQRIQLLEDELVATGRDLSQSGSTLKKRLKDSEHEIRKLWDLSNKRNKVDIAQNKKTLDTLAKALKELEAAQKGQLAALADEKAVRENKDKALQTEQQVFNGRLVAISSDLAEARAALETLQDKQSRLDAGLDDLNSEVKDVKSRLSDMKQEQAGLGNEAMLNVKETLSVYGERLDAIDASRRQLTSNVTRLNTDVNRLQLEMKGLIKNNSPSAAASAPAQ
ncbi:hypothetical protein [Oceanospirillum linum]|uniref:Uncharacterized protein n=1 Tax=Oceanospirillum linum TaxID=966 RepID=A0A1T1H928_OCELI|nr:hypothetical protein [Oceanospirillum linum]OOV86343.1 hypothetical protein BTA35_0214110 [Oceanospirillum linum]SEG48003.1 hypothetical protein SAMN04489856_11271 [Oleiphilus messinensis]SMP31210.1 hypothetical protein SAMN06264348_10888 [Oceanospirillum linum]